MNIKQAICIGILLTMQGVLCGSAIEKIDVSGAFLGGHSLLVQEANYRGQFDYAVNLDFNLTFSERLTGIVQLQMGPGNGSLGFQGPSAVLTDVNLNLALNDTTYLIFGSFDTPFGAETNRLTNNADSFNQPFLLNNLLYSAFAGPVGTLNTLGFMFDKTKGRFNTTVAFTNGTGETSVNEGNTFEVVGRQLLNVTETFFVGVSGMYSNDISEKNNEDTNSFGVEFTGGLAEAYFDNEDHFIGASYGALRYDDGNSSTKDKVSVMSFQVGKRFNALTLAARVSNWNPEADSVNTISTGINSIGLGIDDGAYSVDVSSSLSRYQLGVSYAYMDGMSLNSELVVDNYDDADSRDVIGIISYINAKF